GPWEETENWPTEFISGRQIQGVSCPSVSLCVGVTDQGNVYSSTHPTGPASAWNVAQIDEKGRNTHLEGISCPTVSLCVVVSGGRNDSGEVLTSTDPSGGAAAWQTTQVDESPDLRAVSCGSPSLCVAVGDEGRIVTSTNPTGGASAWRIIGAPGGPGSLRAISCVGTQLCVSGNKGGNLLISTNPTGGLSSWREVDGGGSVQITGVSCPSASECLAVDSNGDVLTSIDPAGGKAAWSFGNLLPFTEAEGNALFGASCLSRSLCALTGARGQIFTSSDPFAKQSAPKGPSRRRRPKRPRVRIASVHLPFRDEIRHHNGKVTIRFYARGRVRGFLCKLDHKPFRRCRSPKRYQPVGVGRHVFQVKAIGMTGLRGPIAREPFTINRLCSEIRGRRKMATVCT
ncbi:MAG: WD40/YVTN/BNR-like repeat-containing protein, partial [Isosphaeraceae bacterium]